MRVTKRRASHTTCRILIPAKLPARCSGYRSSDYIFSDSECDVMIFVLLRKNWRTAFNPEGEGFVSVSRLRRGAAEGCRLFPRLEPPSHNRLFLQLLHYPSDEKARVSHQRERHVSSFVDAWTKKSCTADKMKKECPSPVDGEVGRQCVHGHLGQRSLNQVRSHVNNLFLLCPAISSTTTCQSMPSSWLQHQMLNLEPRARNV